MITDKLVTETPDYVDVFNVIAEKLSEPFDRIMISIEIRCREKLLAKGYNNDQLMKIDSVFKETNTDGLKVM